MSIKLKIILKAVRIRLLHGETKNNILSSYTKLTAAEKQYLNTQI